MNYSNFFLPLSLFFCFSMVAIEPRELLELFKALAENEHGKINDYYEKPFRSKKDIEINYLFGKWYNEETYNQEKNDWLAREHIDHIKIIYNGQDGRRCIVYLQLEDSVHCPSNVTGFIAKLIFERYYKYNEKKVYAALEKLLRVLTLDQMPKVRIYKSFKKRLVKRGRSTIEMNDLYSVCVDYYDPNKNPDWYSK